MPLIERKGTYDSALPGFLIDSPVGELRNSEEVALRIRRINLYDSSRPGGSRSTRSSQYRQAAIDRLRDAEILSENHRDRCSWYICGIALECILKYILCRYHGEIYLTDIDLIYVTAKGHDLEFLFKEAHLWESFKRSREVYQKYQDNYANWGVAIRYQTGPCTSNYLTSCQEIYRWISEKEMV